MASAVFYGIDDSYFDLSLAEYLDILEVLAPKDSSADGTKQVGLKNYTKGSVWQ